MAKHKTRESWLMAALGIIKPLFAEQGYAKLPAIRVSCGWPLGSRKAIGQAWTSEASGDGTFELFISPSLEDYTVILSTLIHEVVHAVVGLSEGHKGEFRKLATSLGLEGKMTATVSGKALTEKLSLYQGNLGQYPHAALSPSSAKKQGTRMIKMECPDCGYVARTTRKWLEVGLPTCPCGIELGEVS